MRHVEKRQIFVIFHNSLCCYAYGYYAVFLKAAQVTCLQGDSRITRFSVLTLAPRFWVHDHSLIS